MSPSSPPPRTDAVRKNRRFWEKISDAYERTHESALRADDGQAWGLWRIPERELGMLGPVRGRRVLELGCGAGRWSVGLSRRGAHPVGLDLSPGHLRHAAASMGRARIRFPLIAASAERLPLRDATFDVVFCDYGAMSFADPYRTLPEVARVLRPGGIFAFATFSPFRFVAHDLRADRIGRLLRNDYFAQHRVDFPRETDFTLPFSEWMRLFRENGFAIEGLVEPRGGPSRRTTYLTGPERAWSGKFPMEAIWKLRKAAERAGREPSARARKTQGRLRPRRSHGKPSHARQPPSERRPEGGP